MVEIVRKVLLDGTGFGTAGRLAGIGLFAAHGSARLANPGHRNPSKAVKSLLSVRADDRQESDEIKAYVRSAVTPARFGATK